MEPLCCIRMFVYRSYHSRRFKRTRFTFISNLSSLMNMEEAWKGICYDDGTGRNVLYVDVKGQRQRKQPDHFVPELFPTGERRYYYRGYCIRCRTPSPSVFLFRNSDYVGFSLNYCASCAVAMVGESPTGVRKIGDQIWAANVDTPKHFYCDLQQQACDINREAQLIQRSREAKHHVRVGSKARRNEERFELVKQKAIDNNVHVGELISWGFDAEYDEYFGTLNKDGEPDGLGVKFYSDGTLYVGEWEAGLQHSYGKALWQRPDGSQYEGNFIRGLKHGIGTQIFPDGSKYRGEFAKGYEHGHGTRFHKDGSIFEGRYRFGKKDGPGVLTTADKQVERRNFKESEVFHERPVPEIIEVVADGDKKYFEPDSLMQLSIAAVAKAMHKNRPLVPCELLHQRLPEFMKDWVARKYLLSIYPKGTQDFIDTAPNIAFKAVEVVNFKAIRFAHFDCESMLYFISANKVLKELYLSMNRLDPASLDMINRKLFAVTWPLLQVLDLSFNRLDVSTVRNLIGAVKNNPTIEVLKLAGCNINPSGAEVISRFMMTNTNIVSLDLSFNVIRADGAEFIAEAIKKNTTLTNLNLRNNGLGSIGGQTLADAMAHNYRIRELCLVDNKVGFEVMTLLAARLRGTVGETTHCVRATELEIPAIHWEKRVRDAKH